MGGGEAPSGRAQTMRSPGIVGRAVCSDELSDRHPLDMIGLIRTEATVTLIERFHQTLIVRRAVLQDVESTRGLEQDSVLIIG